MEVTEEKEVGTGLINLCIILKVGDVTESENPCTEG
jgi:hypothetical protein